MKRTDLLNRPSAMALAGALASLILAGCNPASNTSASSAAPGTTAQQAPAPIAALALSDGTAPTLANAPALTALPAAPPAPVARLAQARDSYAYAERAAIMNQGFSNAPPDYTYDDGGIRPWVWQANNGAERIVEPVSGGNRYYYYQPGSDVPFLVRDPEYTYGFEGGQLVVVYDRSGRALAPEYVDGRAGYAGRYLARGRYLFDSARQQRHEAVAAANWRERQRALAEDRDQWDQDESQDPDWRAYHDQNYDSEASQWDDERYRRDAESARFAETVGDAVAATAFWSAATQAQNHQHGSAQGGFTGQGQGGGQGGGQRGGPGGGAAVSPAETATIQATMRADAANKAAGQHGGPGGPGHPGGPAAGVSPAETATIQATMRADAAKKGAGQHGGPDRPGGPGGPAAGASPAETATIQATMRADAAKKAGGQHGGAGGPGHPGAAAAGASPAETAAIQAEMRQQAAKKAAVSAAMQQDAAQKAAARKAAISTAMQQEAAKKAAVSTAMQKNAADQAAAKKAAVSAAMQQAAAKKAAVSAAMRAKAAQDAAAKAKTTP